LYYVAAIAACPDAMCGRACGGVSLWLAESNPNGSQLSDTRISEKHLGVFAGELKSVRDSKA